MHDPVLLLFSHLAALALGMLAGVLVSWVAAMVAIAEMYRWIHLWGPGDERRSRG
jgi:hypothetical protein